MPMSLDLTPKAESPDPAPVAGISEWACYYANHPHGPAPDPERVIEDTIDRHPDHAVTAMHRHGKACIGGVGSKCLIEVHKTENTGFYDPQPVYAMADLEYAAGVDAISLYQSESLARMDYLASMLPELARPSICARRTAELPRPEFPANYPIACDWHSLPEGQEALDVEIAGNQAL